MAALNDMLPSYEMEEGEIFSPTHDENSEKTIMTKIKDVRKEMEQFEEGESPAMMDGCFDYEEKTQPKRSNLKVGDITFDEDGFRAMWIALIFQERKIDQLESALNAMSGGDGKSTPRITRDEMLQCMKDAIEEIGSSYGVSKQLLRKVVSERLGIDIRGSNYLQKKFNAVMKYGLDTRVIIYDPKDQMFHNA